MDDLTDQATTFFNQLADWAAEALPNLVAAIVLLIFGWWLAARLGRGAVTLLGRSRVDKTLHNVVATTVRYAVLIVVFVAVLGQLGIQTTSILAALGALGLAIGLALQGTLSNIAAGMMLLWLRPFRTGDYIDAEGIAGTVVSIGLFNTELHSWDGIYLFAPNSQVWNKRVANYSRLPTRMVSLEFGVAYDDDIARGKEVLLALARSDERALAEPEPIVFVGNLGDSAVVLNLRVWANTGDYWALRRWLTEEGKRALEAAGLSIPFPQRDVHHYGLAPGAPPPDAGQGRSQERRQGAASAGA